MEQTLRQPLNQAQTEVLNSMAHLHTDEDLRELRSALAKFFAERADREIERLWDEGTINENVLEGWKYEHMRTPYRPKM